MGRLVAVTATEEPGSVDPLDVIAQAMGIVSVQADCTIDESLVLMETRALVNHCGIDEIAIATIEGSIRFGE